ncbi:hypothetical protein LXL04_007954 [Taraxacum kok-saghyz]
MEKNEDIHHSINYTGCFLLAVPSTRLSLCLHAFNHPPAQDAGSNIILALAGNQIDREMETNNHFLKI